MDPVVVVHGGAWAIPDALVARSLNGVCLAARKAWKILNEGGSAIDAVEAGVVVLEDDDAFDAGTGSVLTSAGTVEMDAIIMDGSKLQCGSVACVENIKNPVKLARLVMEKTDHILLVGKGANAFALECGIDTVPMEQLVTREAIESLQLYRKYKSTVVSLFSDRKGNMANSVNMGHETVGCVALDRYGSLASATSTGGITAKRPGRVGDTPLIGSGAYADNNGGAVSCTGHGESIAKICLAKMIADDCSKVGSAKEAIINGLDYMNNRVGQAGGAICISKEGNHGIGFITERMAWAVISKESATCGINPNETILMEEILSLNLNDPDLSSRS